VPAGRPATTGESDIVRFRARPPLGDRLEARRTYPDLRSDPLYGGPRPKDGQAPKAGTVATRDLAAYYALLDAELADAAAQLDRGQVLMILDAVHGLATDATWITNAPALLAGEIADAHGDDEDECEPERAALAALVRSWPRLRAYAVLEAALALHTATDPGQDIDKRLAAVGLGRPGDHR
jgi:hypothetical protein